MRRDLAPLLIRECWFTGATKHKQKRKHKPRVKRHDASTSARKWNARTCAWVVPVQAWLILVFALMLGVAPFQRQSKPWEKTEISSYGQFRHVENSPQIFTRNAVRSKISIFKHVGDVLREFGVSSRTFQNRPCSKPWAIAQAFWSKSVSFGPLKILPKSSLAMPYAVRNPFSSMWAMF